MGAGQTCKDAGSARTLRTIVIQTAPSKAIASLALFQLSTPVVYWRAAVEQSG
jgi:hypothetical protein